jgi:hypothetical protein
MAKAKKAPSKKAPAKKAAAETFDVTEVVRRTTDSGTRAYVKEKVGEVSVDLSGLPEKARDKARAVLGDL